MRLDTTASIPSEAPGARPSRSRLEASWKKSEILEAYLNREAQSMLATSQAEILTSLGDLVSEVDRRAVDSALGEFIVRETAHSLATGVWGWFDDNRAILGDWGFELTGIRAPLHVWHGAQDRFVPIAHSEWLVAHVHAEPHLRPDDGHLSLSLNAYGEILDALIEDSRVGAAR